MLFFWQLCPSSMSVCHHPLSPIAPPAFLRASSFFGDFLYSFLAFFFFFLAFPVAASQAWGKISANTFEAISPSLFWLLGCNRVEGSTKQTAQYCFVASFSSLSPILSLDLISKLKAPGTINPAPRATSRFLQYRQLHNLFVEGVAAMDSRGHESSETFQGVAWEVLGSIIVQGEGCVRNMRLWHCKCTLVSLLFDLSELLCCEQTRWSFASVLCCGWPKP